MNEIYYMDHYEVITNENESDESGKIAFLAMVIVCISFIAGTVATFIYLSSSKQLHEVEVIEVQHFSLGGQDVTSTLVKTKGNVRTYVSGNNGKPGDKFNAY